MSNRCYPTVVLVGRTNVGKSTVFNRMAKDAKSIVFDRAGVTRDLVKDIVEWQGKSFELIDSGGIGFENKTDFMSQEIRKRAELAISKAHVAIFVCDGSVGVVPEDLYLARLLHRYKVPAFAVVNKIDTKTFREEQFDFSSLGFEHIIELSAVHGTGMVDLMEQVIAMLPSEAVIAEPEQACSVVLLGKPNVGKSSLLNLLVQADRSIVSDIPGTTREPIVERIQFYHQDILLTDTAGVRRQGAIEDPLENLMAKSTLQVVRRADIVLLLVDAHEGQLSDQELKLAFYAFQSEQKALILLLNKVDLTVADEYTKQLLKTDIEAHGFLTDKIYRQSISCKTGQNIGKILPLVAAVEKKLSQQFTVEDLTILFKTALEKTPLFWNKNRLIVYRAQQIKSSPHIIALYVNSPDWFGDSQKAFFENVLRKAYDLTSVPVKFVIRKR